MTEAADEPEVEEGCSRHTTNREQRYTTAAGSFRKRFLGGLPKNLRTPTDSENSLLT